MIGLALYSYLAFTQTKTFFQKIPQPASPTLSQVAERASVIAKRVGAQVSGLPQARWLEFEGGFMATWANVSVDFYAANLEPKMYLDSSVRHIDSGIWYANAEFLARNSWLEQGIKKAIVQPQLLAELKPDFRNVGNRFSQPGSNSLIEVRWAIQSKNGIPFHQVNPPQVAIDFDAKTHRIATISWRLNYKAVPLGKAFNKQRAVQKLSDLFAAYFKRNGKPEFSPANLDVQLMYVTDNGSRLFKDGTGTWGSGTPNLAVRTYQVAYVGTYGREQVWLDASTLSCIGGFFGPQ